MPSVRVKICALKMFSPAALNEPAILPNKPGAVPCADFDEVVAAVGFVQPRGHGRERAVVFADQPVHETVREFQVVEDFSGRVDFKIPRRQRGKMRVQFLVADQRRRQFAHFLLSSLELLFRGAPEFRAAGEQRHCARMQLPEQRILEAVPQLVARALRIGEREQREQVQIFRRLDLPRKISDDRRVVQVAPLRKVRHEQMVFDDEPQRVRRRAVQCSRLAARIAISALTSAWLPFLWASALPTSCSSSAR